MRKSSVVLLCLLCTTCAVPPSRPRPPVKPDDTALNLLLNKNSPFAEDSLYSCLLNLYYQGFSLDQARDECATKLLKDDNKQGIETPTGRVGPGSEKYFDPSKVTASCNSGNPKVGQNSSGYKTWPGHGDYTWGGDPRNFYGLTPKQSFEQKEKAVKEYEKANKEFMDAADKADKARDELNQAKKTGDKEAIKKAQEKYDDLYRKAQGKAAEAQQKGKDANADPNKKPKGNSRTVGGETPCEQALQGAREFLYECNRTQWKSAECKQLQAKMNGCPDPTMILVDPEQGYACGDKIDKEALKNAWVARCEELKRFGPGGDNPCLPPTIDNPGRSIKGKVGDIVCRGDPRAYIDPGSTSCQTELKLPALGQVDIQKIIVYGLNKLGGPVVVIPSRDPKPPKPGPGPDPRPGPKNDTDGPP